MSSVVEAGWSAAFAKAGMMQNVLSQLRVMRCLDARAVPVPLPAVGAALRRHSCKAGGSGCKGYSGAGLAECACQGHTRSQGGRKSAVHFQLEPVIGEYAVCGVRAASKGWINAFVQS